MQYNIVIMIIIALVFSVLAPLFKMEGQLVTRFGNHHLKLVNHFNLSDYYHNGWFSFVTSAGINIFFRNQQNMVYK